MGEHESVARLAAKALGGNWDKMYDNEEDWRRRTGNAYPHYYGVYRDDLRKIEPALRAELGRLDKK